MKPKAEIKIRSLEGKPLGEIKERSSWSRRTHTTVTQDGIAKIISEHLALYRYEKPRLYIPARYHVIHIPTGLVIADVEYDLVKTVKDSFESLEWDLINDNTFVLKNNKLQWSMTCLKRYSIITE